MADRTAWLAACGWGAFCHYLGAAPSADGGAGSTAEARNRQVDAFDTEALACQLAGAGVPCFCIAIGQSSAHCLAPDEVYEW